jgi:DNA replication protein DnaC
MQNIGQTTKDLLSRLQNLKDTVKTTLHQNELKKLEEKPEKSKNSYECERCDDENGYLILHNGMQVWRECECLPAKRIKRIMRMSEITPEMQNKTFENFDTENKSNEVKYAKDVAATYYLNFDQIRKQRNNSFAIVGQVGSGKTHLSFAISNALLGNGCKLIYFPYVEGMSDLKSNFDLLEEKLDRLKKADVLFIDDLFKGRDMPTNWQIEMMFAVINYRYLNHLPILITSEKDFDKLLEIDEAIGSRIYEMTKSYRFVFKGKELNQRLK